MSDQQQRKKIRMKIKTSIDTRFIFAANPKMTVQEISDQIAKACQQFLPSHSKVKRIKALKKDDFYLRTSEVIGDLVDDLDEIYCQIELLGRKRDNQQSRITKESRQVEEKPRNAERIKEEVEKADETNSPAEEFHRQKSEKGKRQKDKKPQENKKDKTESKASKSNFNAQDVLRKLHQVQNPKKSEKGDRKSSSENNPRPKSQTNDRSKQKPKKKTKVVEEDEEEASD